MSPRPEDLAAMDTPSARARDESTDIVARLRAVLAHLNLNTASARLDPARLAPPLPGPGRTG